MSQRFDWVVVERLLAGIPTPVHPDERDATVRELVRRGMSLTAVATVQGWSWPMVAVAS